MNQNQIPQIEPMPLSELQEAVIAAKDDMESWEHITYFYLFVRHFNLPLGHVLQPYCALAAAHRCHEEHIKVIALKCIQRNRIAAYPWVGE